MDSDLQPLTIYQGLGGDDILVKLKTGAGSRTRTTYKYKMIRTLKIDTVT